VGLFIPCCNWGSDIIPIELGVQRPNALRKVAQPCEDFGSRRPYSVSLCRLTAHDLVRLKSRLYDIITLQEDQVVFIRQRNRCAERNRGAGSPVEKHDARVW